MNMALDATPRFVRGVSETCLAQNMDLNASRCHNSPRRAPADLFITLQPGELPMQPLVTTAVSEKPGTEYDWIIDPLDGTTNFLQGIPHFCVSIAARREGVLEHAVIFDPVRNELFTASRGEGAHLNERRIRVSPRSRVDRAVAATGFSYKSAKRIDPWLSTIRDVTLKTSGIRRAGSAALDLAYVACGRVDAFWEMDLNLWDIAAGTLLVEEAGGLVCDFAGEQRHLETGDILATNLQMHDDFRGMMKPFIAT